MSERIPTEALIEQARCYAEDIELEGPYVRLFIDLADRLVELLRDRETVDAGLQRILDWCDDEAVPDPYTIIRDLLERP